MVGPERRKYLPYQRQMGQVPIIGPWYGRAGKVYNILSTPCDVSDPAIWVQAAFWHAPQALVSLFGPDCLDDKFTAVQKGLRPHRKGQLGIAGIIPAASPPPLGAVGWAMFRMANMSQAIGWWMLVGDVATNFALNWTSSVYRWNGCHVAGTPHVSSGATVGANLLPVGEGSGLVDCWEPKVGVGYAVNNNNVSTPGNKAASIGWHIATEGGDIGGIGPASYTMQLVNSAMGDVGAPVANARNGTNGSSAGSYYYNIFEFTECNWYVRYTKSFGHMIVSSGHISAYGGDVKTGLSPAACGLDKDRKAPWED